MEDVEFKAKRYAEGAERVRAWDEAKAKEKDKIVRIADEARRRSKTKAAERVKVWAKAEAK